MEETICAIATSLGVGAISIIRVSGSKTIEIVNSIFSSDISNTESHVIKYGHIIDDGEIIDEVLLMIMKAPKTYTREDIIEINCHGGYNTTNKILQLLLKKGCQLAEPGEFTKRAFLNGRLNLLQAEAVNELISAKSDAKRKLCLNQLGNNLTNKINNVRELLISLMANIEVNIDYPEYTDNLVITESLLEEKLAIISKDLSDLVEGSHFGKIVNNGINVAIIGKPNVGKSSILNHLLDENKAIVTDIAGTTRDIVEGTVSFNGIEVKLIDTAGIHQTEDVVEKIGVQKSINVMHDADVILLVLDMTRALEDEDKTLLSQVDLNKTIVFINKNDVQESNLVNIKAYLSRFINSNNIVLGNTINPEGLKDLKNKLIDFFNINNINKDLTYLSNARQIDLINKANDAVKTAQEALKHNVPIDMIESDLKRSYDFLGLIIGDTYEEALIDRLFRDFCVGK